MRPKKQRVIKSKPKYNVYAPENIKSSELEKVEIGFDELEALRLTNTEDLSQIETAEQMGVSRQLVGLILSSVRKKITDALLNGKAIVLVDNNKS